MFDFRTLFDIVFVNQTQVNHMTRYGMLTSCKCEAFVLDRLLECEDYDDPVAVSLGLWELDEAWRVASIP